MPVAIKCAVPAELPAGSALPPALLPKAKRFNLNWMDGIAALVSRGVSTSSVIFCSQRGLRSVERFFFIFVCLFV